MPTCTYTQDFSDYRTTNNIRIFFKARSEQDKKPYTSYL